MEEIFGKLAKDFGIKYEESVQCDLDKIAKAIEAANKDGNCLIKTIFK